ncbi:MAG TPA: type II secretion system protein [Phycisphaerales bacterium]|nr:type II secretion system protein [Phycisphaerales bacterium]
MKSRRAFTIVEIMVVIGIIALLVSLLMPALSSVRKTSQATKSMSNLRQWGIGTINYCAINKDLLPWEGLKNPGDMPVNFADRNWWANAIPPLVGQRPYKEISEEATSKGLDVPLPPNDDSIFVDPAAVPTEGTPWHAGTSTNLVQFFFCYVPNSQLNNTYANSANTSNPYARMKLGQISKGDATILMLEMRSNKNELSRDDPYYNEALNRHRSDWKRFAARHFDGGHMLFADGHVDRVLNEVATTNNHGVRDPHDPNGDWNQSKLVWDPMGPALDDN